MNEIPKLSKKDSPNSSLYLDDEKVVLDQTILGVFQKVKAFFSVPIPGSLSKRVITTPFSPCESTYQTYTDPIHLFLRNLYNNKNQKNIESYLCEAGMTREIAKKFAKILVDLKSEHLSNKEKIKSIVTLIKNQKINSFVLKEIVDLCLEIDFDTTLPHIVNFGIKNQNHLIEIAKCCANKSGEQTAKFIKHFAIQETLALIEIAKICANQSPLGTAKYIQNFEITNKTALVEIAKLCGSKDFSSIQKHLKNFEITEVDDVIELAKFFLQQDSPKRKDPFAIAEHIKSFAIDPNTQQAALVKIAKICAEEDPSKTVQHIQNFGFNPKEQQKALIEIATICAKKDPSKTVQHIQNFGFNPKEQQEALIEIAAICAKKNPFIVAEKIDNFRFDPKTKQKALIKIAINSATENPDMTAKGIEYFGINPETQQEGLIKIATICAEKTPYITVKYIENFGIHSETQQEALIKIVTICANKYIDITAERIKNFGITNQEVLTDIALLFALKGEKDFLHYFIENFETLNKDALNLIRYIIYLRKLSDKPIEELLNYINKESLPENIRNLIKKDFFAFYSNEKEIKKLLEKKEKKIKEQSDPAIEKFLFLHLMAPHFGTIKPINEIPKLEKNIELILLKIFNLRNADLIFFLLECLDRVMKKPFFKNHLIEVIDTDKDKLNYALPIFLVFIDMFEKTNLSEENQENLLKEYKEVIQKTLQGLRHDLKSSGTGLMVQFIKTLQLLQQSKLPSEKRLHLLISFCKKLHPPQKKADSPQEAYGEQFLKELNQLTLLLEIATFDDAVLDDLQKEPGPDRLKKITKKALLGEMPLTAEQNELFETNYLKLQKEQRRHLALELYASRIRSLQDPSLTKVMNHFALNVLEKTFSKWRYRKNQLTNHTRILRDQYPLVWNKWKTLSPMTALQSQSPITETDTNNSYEWLRQTLVTDNHLPNSKDITPLIEFLKKGLRPKDSEFEGPYGPIQKLCIKLCNPNLSVNEGTILLRELQKMVKENSELSSTQWRRDIDDRITLLCSQKEIENLQIGITDNWQDLFLSGTEVLGSCQTIYGDTSYNKCLLSYCTDAKIQMVAIKKASSGTIVSRALLKLLFYKNPEGNWVPALFFERIYPNTTSKFQENALKATACQRAQDLGIDLYIKSKDSDPEDQKIILTSLASSSPYEYEDGGAGISDGSYAIKAKKVSSYENF